MTIPRVRKRLGRDACASRLVMSAVELRTVQQLMGHKTIQMTAPLAQLVPEHQMAAVKRLCSAASALEVVRVKLEILGARSSVGRATHF